MEYPTAETEEHFKEIDQFEGGPAFPHIVKFNDGNNVIFHGMTMRQYYAAKAMQTLLTASDIPTYQGIAIEAFNMADAMLKAENA